jgi:hypothetical protein
MAASQSCYRRTNPSAPRLIESYCAGCGLLIAASPSGTLLAIVESIHMCPVHGYYGGMPPRKPVQAVQQPGRKQEK